MVPSKPVPSPAGQPIIVNPQLGYTSTGSIVQLEDGRLFQVASNYTDKTRLIAPSGFMIELDKDTRAEVVKTPADLAWEWLMVHAKDQFEAEMAESRARRRRRRRKEE